MPYLVKSDLNPSLEKIVVRKGKTARFEFDSKGLNTFDHHRLYMTGEDTMHYLFKDEPFGDKLYMLIEDSLNQSEAEIDRYCLDLSEDTPRPFSKWACKKFIWPAPLGIFDVPVRTEVWNFGIFAKAEGLKIEEGGYVRFCIERWDAKDGVNPHETKGEPDGTEYVDIKEGSYGYTDFAKDVFIPDSTATVLITLEAENYSGKIYVERPHLTASGGDNVLPAFDVMLPCYKDIYRDFGWVGKNLSKKEWPRFQMILNGEVFFEDEVFIRIHRWPDIEIDIPDGLIKDKNVLEIKYISDYHDTVPMSFREVKILEKEKSPIHIHFVQKTAVKGKDIPVLIETEEDNMTLEFASDELTVKSPLTFEEKGLHAILLAQDGAKNDLTFTLSYGDTVKTGKVEKTIERPDDNVVCGSGDLIYIDNSSEREMSSYLEWVFANELASLLTIRPAYRWGGQRTINAKVWKKFNEICNTLGVDYVHMLDGRDLPGMDKNPHPDMLAGEHFLGRQLHERDGQAFYWSAVPLSTKPINECWLDMCGRLYRNSPLTTEGTYASHNMKMQKGLLAEYRNTDSRGDMKRAHDISVDTLRKIRRGEPRHTGPSIMFKYFYEAGFEWVGAETMDSPTEPLLAFMRGASKAYGKKRSGVHHALQWGTCPHEHPERYRRYLLANYVSYLQGVTDLNTEEGLWHIEANYFHHNRFSDCCEGHAAMQHKFYKFITNHSRTGEYYTPTALVHGRYDGHQMFGSQVFGQPSLKFGDIDKSWQVKTVFYPQSALPTIGYFPEGYGKIGVVSGTPNGNFDAVPIENGNFDEYKFAAFAGYNCAENADMDKMYEFVKNGGTLVAALPHFSTITNRETADSGVVDLLDHPFIKTFAPVAPTFKESTVKGKKVHVCINLNVLGNTVATTDDGLALVVEYKIGEGRLVLMATAEYPGNEALLPVYKSVIGNENRAALEREPVYVKCNDDVQYAMYKQENGETHVYVTAVDWYNKPDFERSATLVVGNHEYKLAFAFGDIIKIVTDGKVAAWPSDTDFEVMTVKDGVKVQGAGECVVSVAKDGKVEKKAINIGKDPTVIIK